MSNRMSELLGDQLVAWERFLPERGEAEQAAVAEAVAAGYWCSLGSDLVERVEVRLARLLGRRHVVLVANGTVAATVVARALRLADDEVVVPAGTFVPGTLGGLLDGDVWPRVVDTTSNWTIDPDAAEAAITRRTVAIAAVGGLYDRVADMPALARIAERHGLAFLNDACHVFAADYRDESYGAVLNGMLVANYGLVSWLSFQAHKCVTGGELGAIVTDDDELADRLRVVVTGGRPKGLGGNTRPHVFAVALLEAELDRAPEQHATREQIAPRLRQVLVNHGLDVAPSAQPGDRLPQYSTSALLTPDDLGGVPRDIVMEALSWLTASVVQPPYWGPFNDPKWAGISEHNQRRFENDSVYRQAMLDTLEPRKNWGEITEYGIVFEPSLPMNRACPDVVDRALTLVTEQADSLRQLEPLPRPAM